MGRNPAVWVSRCTEGELHEWLRSLRWQPLRSCLQHALLQVTHCYADSRFELRRMADQVLRPLAETALWADLPVLQQLWASFLPLVDSLPCWVSTSTLLLVLKRTHTFGQALVLAVPPPVGGLLVAQLGAALVAARRRRAVLW